MSAMKTARSPAQSVVLLASRKMNDSMEDFEPTKTKPKRKPLTEIRDTHGNSSRLKGAVAKRDRSRSSDDAGPGKLTVRRDRSTQVPVVRTAEKSTQAGWENAVNYSKKTERTGLVTYRKLIQEIIPSKMATIQFCQEMGLLPKRRQCPTCAGDMSLIADSKVRVG